MDRRLHQMEPEEEIAVLLSDLERKVELVAQDLETARESFEASREKTKIGLAAARRARERLSGLPDKAEATIRRVVLRSRAGSTHGSVNGAHGEDVDDEVVPP